MIINFVFRAPLAKIFRLEELNRRLFINGVSGRGWKKVSERGLLNDKRNSFPR